jgi:hypothetical protein
MIDELDAFVYHIPINAPRVFFHSLIDAFAKKKKKKQRKCGKRAFSFSRCEIKLIQRLEKKEKREENLSSLISH